MRDDTRRYLVVGYGKVVRCLEEAHLLQAELRLMGEGFLVH